MKIGKRKTILWSGTKGRQKNPARSLGQTISLYAKKNPPKNHSTLHSTIYSFVYKHFNAERFEAQTFQQPVTKYRVMTGLFVSRPLPFLP